MAMKILIVDDVGIIRHYLSRNLEPQGFTTNTVRNGPEAIEALKLDNGIEVVVTDLMMPGMSGIDLYRQAQQLERMDDTGPVPPPQFVLMTAVRPSNPNGTPNAELKRALDLGFAAVVHKPVAPDELAKILKSLKKGRQAIDQHRYEALLQQIQETGAELLETGDHDLISRYREMLQDQARSASNILLQVE